MKKHIFFVLLCAVVLLPACNRYNLDERIARFEKEMEEYREQTENIGMSVVFVHDNEIAYVRHFGVKNLESQEPIDDATMFRVASISKTFTATSILQQVEQGKVSLKTDAGELLGFPLRNPNYPDSVITLEMLLSHTSSINDDDGFNDYAPGHGYAYCDHNYTLLGMILEQLTGERFDRYIAGHILEPLGLYGGYDVDSLDRSRFASLYQWDGEKYVCTDEGAYASRSERLKTYHLGWDVPLLSPAAGMKMSALDVAKYMLMHMNYGLAKNGVRILGDSTSRDMQIPRSEITDEHFGLGLLQTESYSPGVFLVGHLGGAWGMRGGMFFNPEEKYGFVLMSNGSHDRENNDENNIHRNTLARMYKCFIEEQK